MRNQIEELAELICINCPEFDDCEWGLGKCEYVRREARILYNEGYRKVMQSKWIYYSDEKTSGWLCDNCKKYSTGKKPYCSFCGAKMNLED